MRKLALRGKDERRIRWWFDIELSMMPPNAKTRVRARRFAILSGLWLATAAAAGSEHGQPSGREQFIAYRGQARTADGRELLYTESHVVHYDGEQVIERVVLYGCRDGSAFARKVVDYVTPLAPDFILDDSSNGMRQGMRSDRDGARSVFFRGERADVERTAPVSTLPDLVVDAGFDEFIRARWQALMSGRPQSFEFVVPSRAAPMKFSVKHVHRVVAEGVESELLELKLSGIIGWIAPTIQLYYSIADHMLVRYDGVTDLRDASGDNFKASISFLPQDRHLSTAAAFDAARRAPLRSCK